MIASGRTRSSRRLDGLRRLDPEMVHSCVYFTDWANDLATAQHDKLDIICRKLRLSRADLYG
jgi:hypothetical protein